MKLTGIVFVILSAASVGVKIASSLRNRCRVLRQLMDALLIMRNEISCCGTPLPQVFALMAISADGAVSRLFSNVAKAMDKQRWLTPRSAMEAALQSEQQLGEDQDITEVLLSLASGLGKYDRESQLQILERTKGCLETLLHMAEQECSVRSKTYKVLGICAGVSVAILLL